MIGLLHGLIGWIKWVFATSTTLGGVVILLMIVIIGMSYGLFKQYDCLHMWEKSDFAITAKITAGLGDVTEAVFLVILDHLKTNRMLLGGTGLMSSAVLRITGKIFSNSMRWSYGGIFSEAIGEVALCGLRWRQQLTEGRWKISHRWTPWAVDSQLTPAEQCQLMALLWDINYSTEFEDDIELQPVAGSA